MKSSTVIAIVAVGVVGYLVYSHSAGPSSTRGGLEGATTNQTVLGKMQGVLGAFDTFLGSIGAFGGKKPAGGTLGLDCTGKDCLE